MSLSTTSRLHSDDRLRKKSPSAAKDTLLYNYVKCDSQPWSLSPVINMNLNSKKGRHQKQDMSLALDSKYTAKNRQGRYMSMGGAVSSILSLLDRHMDFL